MAVFYFIRHGEIDVAMAGKKFYKKFAYNMLTLSQKGIEQIRKTAMDARLANAELIITSPFGRALHSAAILSKELQVELRVETDLHEWLADSVTYEFLTDEEAKKNYGCLTENNGYHPAGEVCVWESASQMKQRVMAVLNQYRNYGSVIVVCHGTLMQYVLGIEHPQNGQIEEFITD